jgi:hypothetical protein
MKKTFIFVLSLGLGFGTISCNSGRNVPPGNTSATAKASPADSKESSGTPTATGEAPVEDREAGAQYVIPAGWRYELVGQLT